MRVYRVTIYLISRLFQLIPQVLQLSKGTLSWTQLL